MVRVEEDWQEIKKMFKQAFRSSMHFSIASIDENGLPHISPIGSLVLGKQGQAIYFEEFTRKLPKNIKSRQDICVMAVNSSKWFWLKSLFQGRFQQEPALRLKGKAGIRRRATDKEMELWQKRVKLLAFTKGHGILWKRMGYVRELTFTSCEAVNAGDMTRDLGNS